MTEIQEPTVSFVSMKVECAACNKEHAARFTGSSYVCPIGWYANYLNVVKNGVFRIEPDLFACSRTCRSELSQEFPGRAHKWMLVTKGKKWEDARRDHILKRRDRVADYAEKRNAKTKESTS